MANPIIPKVYKYLRYPDDQPKGKKDKKDKVEKEEKKGKQLEYHEHYETLWADVHLFIDEHKAEFERHPYKRANVRFMIDAQAGGLLQSLNEVRFPYMNARDSIDVELFYYYIIGCGRDFFYATIARPENARQIWVERLFEPREP